MEIKKTMFIKYNVFALLFQKVRQNFLNKTEYNFNSLPI